MHICKYGTDETICDKSNCLREYEPFSRDLFTHNLLTINYFHT